MSVLEAFISIQGSPSDVERSLTDRAIVHEWLSPLFQMELLEGEWMAVGSIYQLRFKTLFLLPVVTYTLVERGESHLRLDFRGVWRGSDRWHWFADGPRTIVQNRVEYELSDPVMRSLLNVFFVIFGQLDMQVQMMRLQKVIEKHTRRSL